MNIDRLLFNGQLTSISALFIKKTDLGYGV